jgi:hypothetical protein
MRKQNSFNASAAGFSIWRWICDAARRLSGKPFARSFRPGAINRSFMIPKGCAHGFLTLEDNSDLLYYMGSASLAGAAEGVRWNDPAFQIPWPEQPVLISERDTSFPDFGDRFWRET